MNQVVEEGDEADTPRSQWWIPIGILVVNIPVLAIVSIATPPDAFYSLISAPFALLGFAITLLSPIFVHLDKQYVESVSTWEPSGWYYWMILPPLTFLSVVYIYQRHKYVGVP
ncbi:hypothetical protein BG842_18980 [Haladaptatus sp. W1]|uniref:hypothetical protein n=1 Tax=Haladaptatus sp. W1 TaxID=1897478 RepID=UPI000849CCA9|nr:hypothetical protein [Haladaptatus sp. W1]ODR82395.1 hypothetical protein BG842_18980 [Haladaptatus sp. W1]